MELEGRAAIVTGAGTGVGAETARRLAALGCDVLVNYSRSQDAAEAVAEEVRSTGVKAFAHRADVSVDADCRDMVAAAMKQSGRLDVLVNNAGTTKFVAHADLEGLDGEDWDKILGVNLKGSFFCSRAARDALEAGDGGEIVMTSSVAGLAATGSSIAYCASKAGVNSLVVSLARALAPKIRVNAVAPGFIDGAWLAEGFGDAYEAIKNAVVQKTPLGRVCTPPEVAQAIVGLIAGPDLITGHVLPIDGGALIA